MLLIFTGIMAKNDQIDATGEPDSTCPVEQVLSVVVALLAHCRACRCLRVSH